AQIRVDRSAGEAESAHAQVLEADDRLLEPCASECSASPDCENSECGCREHGPALHEFPHHSFSFPCSGEPCAGLTVLVSPRELGSPGVAPLSFLSPCGDGGVDTFAFKSAHHWRRLATSFSNPKGPGS